MLSWSSSFRGTIYPDWGQMSECDDQEAGSWKLTEVRTAEGQIGTSSAPITTKQLMVVIANGSHHHYTQPQICCFSETHPRHLSRELKVHYTHGL